jgi:tRNA(Phe) wybutosine-synthesizing methylase Tyw3
VNLNIEKYISFLASVKAARALIKNADQRVGNDGMLLVSEAAIADLKSAQERIDRLESALEKIEIKAQAGLCYPKLDTAREFLKDVRDEVATALGTDKPGR